MKIGWRVWLMLWFWRKQMRLTHSKKIRSRIKRWFDLYDPVDLQVGGHCGLCGRWIEGELLPKDWAWSICDQCMKKEGENVNAADVIRGEIE